MDDSFDCSTQAVVVSEETSGLPPAAKLTNRERDVVQRVLTGKKTKEIAADLAIADSTVRVLLARAAAKCGARTRTELLEKAASFALPCGSA